MFSTVCEELSLDVSTSLYSQFSPAQIKCDLTRGAEAVTPFPGYMERDYSFDVLHYVYLSRLGATEVTLLAVPHRK